MTRPDLAAIGRTFGLPGRFVEGGPFGNGHIHDIQVTGDLVVDEASLRRLIMTDPGEVTKMLYGRTGGGLLPLGGEGEEYGEDRPYRRGLVHGTGPRS